MTGDDVKRAEEISRAEAQDLAEDSDAYQAVVAVMVDYWFAQSSMTLAEAVQKLLDDNEKLQAERDEAEAAFESAAAEVMILRKERDLALENLRLREESQIPMIPRAAAKRMEELEAEIERLARHPPDQEAHDEH
jgi:hypothetical protein